MSAEPVRSRTAVGETLRRRFPFTDSRMVLKPACLADAQSVAVRFS